MSPQDQIREASETFRKVREQTQRDGQYNDNVREIIDRAERLSAQAAMATDTYDAVAETTLETIAAGGEIIVELPDQKRIALTIKPGTPDGTVMTVKMPHREYRVAVRQLPHERFRREGPDLHTELRLNPDTAEYGGETPLPTLTGNLIITIPAATREGSRIRLKGQGLPLMNSPETRGDIYVTARIEEHSQG